MANARKALSKRQRFEIFKRDRFTCQYCGRKPPDVILQVDHIVPVSKGGDNSKVNLVTACRDCNVGKWDIDLETVIPAQKQAIEDGQEKLAQLKAFRKLIKAERAEQDQAVTTVTDALADHLGEVGDSEMRSVRMFLGKLPLDDVLRAADITASQGTNFRYFCGICWSKIREKDEG